MADPAAAPTPPSNLDAEENVLGAMMLSRHAIESVTDVVSASDFYRHSHSVIYQACIDLYDEGGPVDAITVADRLERDGTLKEIGGTARLHEIATLVPATANVTHYARIVREQSMLRSAATLGEQLRHRPSDGPRMLNEQLSHRAQHPVF